MYTNYKGLHMKALILFFTLLFLATQTHANDENIATSRKSIEQPVMDVQGTLDSELEKIKEELRLRIMQERNGKKKIELMQKLMEITDSYIPKRIKIENQKIKDRQKMEAFNKYIQCMNSNQDLNDCNDLKEELNKLTSGSASSENQVLNTKVTNPSAMAKLRQCSTVTQEFFPDFQAVVRLDISVDTIGNVESVYIDHSESEISHDLVLFLKCVVHFARKLQFNNPTGNMASFHQDLIFGRI